MGMSSLEARVVARQRWHDLLFLHWPVPPETVRRFIPSSLNVDTHDGAAYVGIVAFRVSGSRLAGLPERLGFGFLETNVRTYVRAGAEEPGVYFLSLDASSRLMVAGGRVAVGLPYFYARGSLARGAAAAVYSIRRSAGGGPGLRVRYRPGDNLGASQPRSLEHFLIERYLLHVERWGRRWTMSVRHPPYEIQTATILELRDDLVASNGLERPRWAPIAHYATEVDAEFCAPRPATQAS
jgi:uncharacterized protein YqjF (DUF2071 family)